MPGPKHSGTWVSIGEHVEARLASDSERSKAEIYREIGSTHDAHPTIVQRCHAAYVAAIKLRKADPNFARAALGDLPLSIAEVILRWSGYDRKSAYEACLSYDAGKLNLRDLRAQESMARGRRADVSPSKNEQVEAIVATKVRTMFRHHEGFELHSVERGPRSGGAARFPELIGTQVDFVGEWQKPAKGRIAVIVLTMRPSELAFKFRHRVQSAIWSGLGMTRLGWLVVIAVEATLDIKPFTKWLSDHRVASEELDLWPIAFSSES